MDLAEYEHAKFELADILRSAEHKLRSETSEVSSPFADLLARLAEDRFNIVVAGRFNRGKSSLMNALLKTERLPVGVIPVTSVITTVAYGSEEEAFIEYEGRHIPERVKIERLPEFVSQRGNPGNVRGVTTARVFMPAEIMRRGFYFIDTPGLGSSITENTRTTQAFLPQADAILLVTSFESPLSDEELRLIEMAASTERPLFVAVNKHDVVSSAEREEVLQHIRTQMTALTDCVVPPIFSVSARTALERGEESGVPQLERELTRFLIEEKQRAFIENMCARVESALNAMTDASERMRAVQAVRSRAGLSVIRKPAPANDKARHFTGCTTCKEITEALFAFFSKYQSDIIAHGGARTSLTESGDLCAFHIWQYESLASAIGVSAGFAPRLEYLAKHLRHHAAIEDLRLDASRCRACRIRADIERRCADIFSLESGICLPHLQLVAKTIADPERRRDLLLAQADTLQRLAEDMQRFALKIAGNRRALLTTEERSAAGRALVMLAGARSVNGLQRLE